MRIDHDPTADTLTLWLNQPAPGDQLAGWVDVLPDLEVLHGAAPVREDAATCSQIHAIRISRISQHQTGQDAAAVAGSTQRLDAIAAVMRDHAGRDPVLAGEIMRAMRGQGDEPTGPLRLAE